MRRIAVVALALVSSFVPLAGRSEEPVDLAVMTRIRDEGLNRSKVMDVAEYLTDVIGPRLTNSPAKHRADAWAVKKLEEWGLANAHLERYAFGRGWTFSRCDVEMVAPDPVPLLALPTAWTPGTSGRVQGPVERVDIRSEEDLERYHGTLAGKILFVDEPRALEPPQGKIFKRYTESDLENLEEFPVPEAHRADWRERFLARQRLYRRLAPFLRAEKVLATVEISSRDAGLLRVTGRRAYAVGEEAGVPDLVMAAEQYDRICRLLDAGQKVELAVDVEAQFLEDGTQAENVVAEIPGGDLRDQVVMAGAHLDSWHAGTGATDNAAGCAVVMEAARILEAIGAKPRRTIRVALWSGEEEGLDGSRAYVSQHFAEHGTSPGEGGDDTPEWLRRERGPLVLKPDYDRISAYFNLDNGSGRIRGIYAQENAAVVPIFAAWLAPFHDLGATAVTMRDTRGTDHLSFDAVGLPGFQFIQDPLDYFSRTHHTNMDVYDRLQREDLMQASVVMAAFLYDAAVRDGMIPRKPLPSGASRRQATAEREAAARAQDR
jgi:carboxypeptidase Q